ncbi:nuclear transport factor 2 family protein [Lacisediminimonas profundi]|uniref:nuclear transport factor 2 family protein n=1 Tax=Lacisediminimonas profundi TaxID=2603856 RepID=UPI00124B065A|nr:nuclear transport factor 2 family protein [Lacisediminimonas profundi]
MSSEENKQLVLQGYRLFQQQDIEGLMALYDDTIEWIGFDNPNVPFAGSYYGKDEVQQFFRDLGRSMTPVRFEPRELIAEGDKVVALGHAVWKLNTGGQELETDWVHVFTLRDGKVCRFQRLDDGVQADQAFRSTAAMSAGMAQGAQESRPS